MEYYNYIHVSYCVLLLRYLGTVTVTILNCKSNVTTVCVTEVINCCDDIVIIKR